MWWLAPLIQGVGTALLTPKRQEQERKDRQTAATLAYIGNRDLAMQHDPEAKDPWGQIFGAAMSSMSLPDFGGGGGGGGGGGSGGMTFGAPSNAIEGSGDFMGPPSSAMNAGGGAGGFGLNEAPGYQDQFFADHEKYYSDKPQTAALLSGLAKPSMGSGGVVMSKGAAGYDPYKNPYGSNPTDPRENFFNEHDAYYDSTPGPRGPVARQLADMGWRR